MKLWYAPRTRAVRVRWLLEELDVPYELERVAFRPTTGRFFIQDTPTGKIPTLADGEVVMAESGAIVEYILERHGEGRLAPPPGSDDRARFLQWLHFAESTAFPPIGTYVWLTVYRADAADHPGLVTDARSRIQGTLQQVELVLARAPYLLGEEFTAADIMMGFTVMAARMLGVLGDDFPALNAYVERLERRPALQRALA
jgi:glutathione S-transferase